MGAFPGRSTQALDVIGSRTHNSRHSYRHRSSERGSVAFDREVIRVVSHRLLGHCGAGHIFWLPVISRRRTRCTPSYKCVCLGCCDRLRRRGSVQAPAHDPRQGEQ